MSARGGEKLVVLPGGAIDLACLECGFLIHVLTSPSQAPVPATWVPQQGFSGLAVTHPCGVRAEQLEESSSWLLPDTCDL